MDAEDAVFLAQSYLQKAANDGLLTPSTESKRRVLMECSFGELIARGMVEQDAIAFDVLAEKIARAIERGDTLTPDARRWTASYLRGEHVRPETHGRHRGADNLPEIVISEAVDLIAQNTPFQVIMQNRPGRRSKEDEAKICACKIVSEAMTRLSMKPGGVKAIRKHWKKHSPYSERLL